jgi:cation transport ATPase
MLEKFFRVKSNVKIIRIPRQNGGQIKEPYLISTSSVSLKHGGTPSLASNITEKYFTSRLRQFDDFLRHPFSLMVFLIMTIFSSYGNPNNQLFIILAAILFIEWMAIKFVEKKLLETLKTGNLGTIIAISKGAPHFTTLIILGFLYTFTAFLIIYFEIGTTIVTVLKLAGIHEA